MTEKIKFIVNPRSGENKTANFIRKLKHYCRYFNLNYSISLTKSQYHATHLSDDAYKDGFQTIVSVGGDGTLHEILQGVVGKGVILGVVPFGSSNDFSRTAKIPNKLKGSMQVIANRKVELIDVCAIDDGFFINVSSLGFDGEVVARLPKMKSKYLFKYVYILGTLKEAFRYKMKKVRIIRDDIDMGTFNVNLIVVANGKYYGHKMMIAPKAKLNDGYLDVVLISGLSQIRFIANFASVFKGIHIHKDGVLNFKCKKLILLSDEKVYIETDGELTGTLPVEYKIFPKFQKFIMP